MNRVLEQLNIPPQWGKVTGKGVRYAVLDYAPGDKIVIPLNSLELIHYHSYCCQYITQRIAPNSKGFGINVLGKVSEGTWQIQDALKWCLDNGIDVINMSLSAFRSDERIELIQRLIAKGVIICAAAGNESKDKLNFPADQPGVISVGAYMASNGRWWADSNSGPEIEIIAPTYVDVPHWKKDSPTINFNGTSCATPCISGVACLWKEAYPEGNAYDFIEFLKTWAIDYGEPGFDNKTGYGKFCFPEPDQWIRGVPVMRNINLLHPELQPKAQRLIELAKAKGIGIIISQTWRTKQEQDDLYAKGRTKPGNIVTRTEYPYSLHCWGVAFDIAVIIAGKANWDPKYYDTIGPLGESLGLEWGGRWESFVDKPHFQLPGYEVTDLIRKYSTPENFKKSWSQPAKEAKKVVGFEGPAKVIYNGKELSAGILEGRTYVELRALAELLGLNVSWDNITKTATLTERR